MTNSQLIAVDLTEEDNDGYEDMFYPMTVREQRVAKAHEIFGLIRNNTVEETKQTTRPQKTIEQQTELRYFKYCTARMIQQLEMHYNGYR